MTTLRLMVNGEEKQVEGPVTAEQLLRRLELDPRMVVVELNREIVRRPALADTALKDGDELELVQFVGGG